MSRVSIVDKDQFRAALLAVQNELEHSENLSRVEAQARLLDQLGVSTNSRPTLMEVWTQKSRLKTISTLEDQYLCSLAWSGFHLLNRNPEWLEELLNATGIELEYPLVNAANRLILKGLFRKARINNLILSDDDIETTLGQIFSHSHVSALPPSVDVANAPDEVGFQINRIHTDAANHLYIELCGTTRTPLNFAVRNEQTGYTWQSLGSRLTGRCKLYRAI